MLSVLCMASNSRFAVSPSPSPSICPAKASSVMSGSGGGVSSIGFSSSAFQSATFRSFSALSFTSFTYFCNDGFGCLGLSDGLRSPFSSNSMQGAELLAGAVLVPRNPLEDFMKSISSSARPSESVSVSEFKTTGSPFETTLFVPFEAVDVEFVDDCELLGGKSDVL